MPPYEERFEALHELDHLPQARTDKTPTKLPRALVEKILARSSRPGDVVLDPFLGSGQVAVVVARDMGRTYTGFEVAGEYFEFIQTRLGEK